MKKISAVMGTVALLFLTFFNSQAQPDTTFQVKALNPYRLAIAFSKTTNIIFPYSITGVDIGSRDVLAQKAKGAENILQLKAARDGFSQTNVSIVTADGKLTSFLVDYAREPSLLILSLSGAGLQNAVPILSENFNQEHVERAASAASRSKEKTGGMKDKASGIRLSLNGVFIYSDIMLLRVCISNHSNISYDIDQLRFYIHDQTRTKRTAMQEIAITPVFVYDSTGKVAGQSDHTMVFAVPKFTIPDKKCLTVQLMERNGGRHLHLRVKNKKIARAIPVY